MLERLFSILEVAVLEPQPHGGFQGVAPFPRWFFEYHPEAKNINAILHFDSPFLIDFSMRAASLWSSGEEGEVTSGTWTESDAHGKEWMLQAMALNTSGRKLLLIEPARVPLQEAQVLLQKGREKNLTYRSVKRKQKSLRKIEQRYLTLLGAVPDWIFNLDAKGTIVEYSAGRNQLFEEFKPEPGNRLADLLPSDLSAQVVRQIESVLSTGHPQIWRYRNATKSLEILLLPVADDETMCIIR